MSESSSRAVSIYQDAEGPDAVELQPRLPRQPDPQHLQNAIQASNNRDQAEREGWRGLSHNDARNILQQQGVEISDENVAYLRRDWDYENAGCPGLVAAMRADRPGWGGFRNDQIDFSRQTSLGNAAGLSLGQVERAFEQRLRYVLQQALEQAAEDARSNPKYKLVKKLQGRNRFVDLEGQSAFNLEAMLTRISQRIVLSPSYRLAMNTFVADFKTLFDELLTLQNGVGRAETPDQEKERLVELCKAFKESRGKLDAAWTALEDYREQILTASRTIIEDAYTSSNANDTTSRSRSTFAVGMTTGALTLGSAITLYLHYAGVLG